MLPTRLLAAASAGASGSARERAHRRAGARRRRAARGRSASTASTSLRAVALLAQAAGRALVDERLDLGDGVGGERRRRRSTPPASSSSRRSSGERRCFDAACESISPAHGGAARTDPCRRWAAGRCRTCRPASRACRPARPRTPTWLRGSVVAGEARLVVVFDRVGHRRRLAVVARVVAAHDALQLGELADHVGQQVGLGEQRGAVGLRGQRRVAELRRRSRAAMRAHALARARPACRACRDRPPCRARRRATASVFLRSWSKKNLASARRGRTTRSLPSITRAGSAGRDVADDQELVGELAVRRRAAGSTSGWPSSSGSGIPAARRGTRRSNWQTSTLGRSTSAVTSSSSASSSIGAQAAAAAAAACELAHDLGAARGEAGDHRAFVAQLRGVAVGVAQHDRRRGCLEAVAVRRRGRRQAERRTGTTSSPCSATRPCAGRTKLHARPAVGELVLMTFGIGSLAMRVVERLLQAFGQRRARRRRCRGTAPRPCRRCARLQPRHDARRRRPARRASSAAPASAGPSASRPTLTGISFCDDGLVGGLRRARRVTCTASRRGDANGVTHRRRPSARPCALKLSAQRRRRTPRRASSAPSAAALRRTVRRAGSVSCVMRSGRLLRRAARRLRRPRPAAPSGSRAARGCRGSSARRCAPGCGCGRCRRRAR